MSSTAATFSVQTSSTTVITVATNATAAVNSATAVNPVSLTHLI